MTTTPEGAAPGGIGRDELTPSEQQQDSAAGAVEPGENAGVELGLSEEGSTFEPEEDV